MTMQSQENAKKNVRAGLPLARAQRLAAEADSRARKGKANVLYGIGVLGVAALVGAGMMSREAGFETTANASEQTRAEEPIVAAAPSQPETLPVPKAVAQPESQTAPVVPASISVDRTQPQCVQAIETRLDALYQLGATGKPGVESAIRGLVQTALDCDNTQLRITGSMELIGTGLADVRVRWGRADWLLDLAMVETADRQATPPAAIINDSSVEFVIR